MNFDLLRVVQPWPRIHPIVTIISPYLGKSRRWRIFRGGREYLVQDFKKIGYTKVKSLKIYDLLVLDKILIERVAKF